MKISTFLQSINTGGYIGFTTPEDSAAVNVKLNLDEVSANVYIGDGDMESDYQYMGATDLRKVAKLFNKLADKLDPELV